MQLSRLVKATAFGISLLQQEEITLPIAHKEGRFYIDDHGLEDLKQNDQVLLRYLARTNPNGSASMLLQVFARAMEKYRG